MQRLASLRFVTVLLEKTLNAFVPTHFVSLGRQSALTGLNLQRSSKQRVLVQAPNEFGVWFPWAEPLSDPQLCPVTTACAWFLRPPNIGARPPGVKKETVLSPKGAVKRFIWSGLTPKKAQTPLTKNDRSQVQRPSGVPLLRSPAPRIDLQAFGHPRACEGSYSSDVA